LAPSVAVKQFFDVWPDEVLDEASAAPGRCHGRVAVRRAMHQLCADVGFEALDLLVEVLGVQAEPRRGGVHAGVRRSTAGTVAGAASRLVGLRRRGGCRGGRSG
jgi:hypothetical protein